MKTLNLQFTGNIYTCANSAENIQKCVWIKHDLSEIRCKLTSVENVEEWTSVTQTRHNENPQHIPVETCVGYNLEWERRDMGSTHDVMWSHSVWIFNVEWVNCAVAGSLRGDQ